MDKGKAPMIEAEPSGLRIRSLGRGMIIKELDKQGRAIRSSSLIDVHIEGLFGANRLGTDQDVRVRPRCR
ncbi:hypothetical protein ACLOJK_038539 [Asimina triloba]